MANANTVYLAKKASSLTDPTSATTFKTSDNSANAAVVYFPILPSNSGAVRFKFCARGRASTTGSHNVTPKVSFGTSATAGSNTIIAAATARAVATTTAVWMIEGVLLYNPTSTLLKGHFTALNGSTATLDAEAVTTSVTADLSVAGKGLTVEMTIATGGGDIGYLDELSLEVA